MMSSIRWLIVLACVSLGIVTDPAPGEVPKGLWLTPRKDSRNQARADVAGRMTTAPTEVWRMSIGGSVHSAHPVSIDGSDAVLIQAGSNLELRRWTGETIWREQQLGVGTVLYVGDFDGKAPPEVLIRTDIRTVILLDVSTGAKVWSWQSDPSTQILQGVFAETESGTRFICFPGYSLNGYCFDFSENREEPKLLWQKSYAGKYGAGYGPTVVLEDMDNDGKDDVVLSSKVPSVYQSVVDVDTGEIKFDVHYNVPDEAGNVWGRPYGLLHTDDLDGDGFADVVMVCCQVEEYLAVARNVGGQRLEKVWSHFVEKDWPTDVKELRPQVTSIADLRGEGKPELVVGLWDGSAWRTLVIDPMQGFEAQRGKLEGYYFWGCHDVTGDGLKEVIISREKKRRPARVTTLAALDGGTLAPVATLNEAAIFASSDSDLPSDTYFMAQRSNPVSVRTIGGVDGILVRQFENDKEVGVFLWGAKRGSQTGTQKIGEASFTRVDLHSGQLVLGDGNGGVQRFGAGLQPRGNRLATSGAATMPLVWEVDGKRELVVGRVGGTIVGGTPDLRENGKLTGRWEVAGSQPVLHLDANGNGHLAAVDRASGLQQAALVYTSPLSSQSKPVRVPLPQPVDGRAGLVPHGVDQFRLLTCLRSGPHTTEFATYDAAGKLLWADKARGAHPNPPAAADLDGDGQMEVISDDHGTLRVYGSDGSVRATVGGPLYCLPIIGPFGSAGEPMILRSSAMNAVVMIDPAGKQIWKRAAGGAWRYYKCQAAVGDSTGNGRLTLGVLAEEGAFELLDTDKGTVRSSVVLGEPANYTPVVAGDVDGDGRDEFLVGFPSGRLVCVAERDARAQILWQKQFDASVANAIIADVNGDALAEIIVSTSDGYVRILKE